MTKLLYSIILTAIFISCNNNSKSEKNQVEKPSKPDQQSDRQLFVTIFPLDTLEHDSKAFTQGLLIDENRLIESTGLNGSSSLRIYDKSSLELIKRKTFPIQIFAEGIAIIEDKLFMLTYKNGKCLVFDKNSLEQISEFSYKGEGWGLTSNGKTLYMSNGSNIIKLINADNYSQIGELEVSYQGRHLSSLNELEWIEGNIWANVWGSDQIVIINPKDGIVSQVIDMQALRKSQDDNQRAEVLNGIAYDPSTKHIWLTGKYWNKYFRYTLE